MNSLIDFDYSVNYWLLQIQYLSRLGIENFTNLSLGFAYSSQNRFLNKMIYH